MFDSTNIQGPIILTCTLFIIHKRKLENSQSKQDHCYIYILRSDSQI